MFTPVSFRVIPVIDLKGGMAVHAVGGRRDQYRPLRSVWQASASPVDLAAAVVAGLDVDCLYLADLDAIAGSPPRLDLYEGIIAAGLNLWLDAGLDDRGRLEPLARLDPARTWLVIGLESLRGPDELAAMVEDVGPGRIVFSLDLDAGRPRVAPGAEWASNEAHDIAARTMDCGVEQILVLDLTRVGTNCGTGTEDLLGRLRTNHPEVGITVGGGIRGIDDVARMRGLGASAVLVGSAIHDGRIGRRELAWLSGGPG
ncbi:MAG: HisA/HisF-related TIM barrel protein [Isosphaeraceae bacterium]